MTGTFRSSFYAALITSCSFFTGFAQGQSNDAKPKAAQDAAESVFKRLDVTGNGYLSGKELDGENARSYDANSDKIVTLEEFVAGYSSANPLAIKKIAEPLNNQKATPQDSKTDKSTGSLTPKRASKAVQPAPAKMINGKPEGLYYMQKYWIATRFLEKSCWYFAPDGKFYEDLSTGFSPADLDAHKGPKGTYKAGGGNLEVVWSDGKSSKAELEIVPGGFNWDTGMFLPVEEFTKGKSVVGSYEGGASLGGGGNSVIVSKSLRLDADGTYTMSGISSLSSTSNGTQAKVGGQSEANGRWSLDGFVLQLTKFDGVSEKHIAFPFDDDKTPTYPDRLFVGGTMYKRQ